MDHRHLISGLVHMLETGPQSTIYNQHRRWWRRRFWRDMLAGVAEAGRAAEAAAPDLTYIRDAQLGARR